MSPISRPPATGYRRDIDGLRAIAILAVVAYHAGLPGVTGGFVGVDVFFVLSGFLITSLIVAEANRTGSVSLSGFYARRIRRLFPAMFAMLLVTCVLGAFVLLPIFGQQQGLGKSAAATALYVSNYFFWLQSPGYFDASAELMPLLHTWSLAVEEQFYIVWPPIVIGAAVIARRAGWRLETVLLAITTAALVASLAWCIRRTEVDPSAAFYLLPSRAWELATGAVTALCLPAVTRSRPLAGTLCSAVGMIAVLAAIVGINQYTSFPGYAATLPVAGTALVIIGGRLAERNPVQAVLSTGPFVTLGLLSYSWYLWHWPLLSLTRAYTLVPQDRPRDLLVVLIALGLAWLSYRLVENPIRYGRPGPFSRDRWTLVAGVSLSVTLCVAAALLVMSAERASRRPEFEPLVRAKSEKPPLRAFCHQDIPYSGLNPAAPCIAGPPGRPPGILLWGDSHAEHFSPLMQAIAGSSGHATISRSFARCPPLARYPKRDRRDDAACAAFTADVLSEIESLTSDGLEVVVLSGRWLRVLGAPRIDLRHAAQAEGPDHLRQPELAVQLSATVERLVALGLKVALVAPLPEMPFDVPACLAREPPHRCEVPRQAVDAQRSRVMALLHDIEKRDANVKVVDFIDQLCDEASCFASRDGIVLYADDNHLSVAGSLRLLPGASSAFLEGVTHSG